MKNILFIITCLILTTSDAQNHNIGLGFHNFTNLMINYELETSKNYNLRLSLSRNLLDGNKSNKKTTYNFGSISAKILNGDIWNFEIHHGPSILVGYYYEYDNFRKNTSYYPISNYSNHQSSSMISTQYHVGLEREIWNNILISAELAAGTHFLFNDNMTILEKYNMGNFIPYIALNIYIGYNF